ncbi:hypothetical protein Pcinc_019267 [Petrolisthes cinctipes]|uniref:Uncharacterized protein n=1 Tax=Petrolisthes cinctipes TaxID=88211 RepID=A0AAE1KLF7_PETCI|nr:hypothetical protein Pcinc_019267 [Petrolisthes cinctipes]
MMRGREEGGEGRKEELKDDERERGREGGRDEAEGVFEQWTVMEGRGCKKRWGAGERMEGRSEDNDGRIDDRVGERTEAEATRREWKEGKANTEKREGNTEWDNPVETETRLQCPKTETKFPCNEI